MEFKGLNEKEVIENRKKYGSNTISKKRRETFLSLFIETLGDPIIKILLIALGIKIIFLFKDFDWYETIGIVIAIFVASFISSISEYGSSKAFQKLEEVTSKLKCLVLRGGSEISITSDEIVYDDIVILTSGDKVPADGILIEGKLSCNESVLSGEAKDKHKIKAKGKNYNEENFLYMASTITSGKGYMRVLSVGDNTFYGKLAKEVQTTNEPSPLKVRLTHLAKIISRIGYVSAFLGAISYLFNVIVIKNNFDINLISSTLSNFPLLFGYLLHALTLSVTIIVVCVPEGLPMMITLVLSSNMKRMLKDNVLVRKLVGIETAGSLNVLFTDKTGTLTKGNLEVVGYTLGNLNTYNSLMEVKGKYKDIFEKSLIYNNDSIYNSNDNTAYGSNITDRALLNFVKKNKSSKVKIINTVPFDSEKKYSISIIEEDNKKIKLIKGAAEKIVNNSNRYYDENGNIMPLNKNNLNKVIDTYTKRGIRVIGISTLDASYSVEYIKNMILVGIVLIKDDIRPEAKEAVKDIKEAGINVVMITGDGKITATSIAKEIGIIEKSSDIVITSEDISKMSDEDIIKNIDNIKVVARSLPSDKSRLVNLAKNKNLVVGMTGDGINDAPALKKADVGFSMGSGTEVAKEASDIIILDDNINSISKAILYGRTIFKSIRKFIICQLTINLCALSVSIIGPFIGVAVPVTVVQMLWINMVMDTLAGLAFSYEAPLKEYMKEKSKSKKEGIINGYMFNQILVMGLYSSLLCIIFLKNDYINSLFRKSVNNEYLLTAFFGLFIFIGIFNSFNARTHRLNIFANILKNKVFLLVIAFILCMQIYLIYYGGSLFRTSGLTSKEFLIMFILALTVIPVDFIRKTILKVFNKKLGV